MQNQNTKAMIRVDIPYTSERSEGGVDIWSPAIPGVYSWGKSEDQAVTNFDRALRQHIVCLIEDRQAIPKFIEHQVIKQIDVLIMEASRQRSRRTFIEMLDVDLASVSNRSNGHASAIA